jgi:outer membrane lipoprotein SlyB
MKYVLIILAFVIAFTMTGCVGEPAELGDDYAESHGETQE